MIHGAQATQYIVSALLDLRISISSYTHHGLHVASIQVFSYFLVGLLSGVERENLIVLNNVVILQFHISIHLWSDYKFMMTFNLLWDTCLLHVNANVLNASKLNLPNWSNIFNSWFQFAIVNLLKLLMLTSIGCMILHYLQMSTLALSTLTDLTVTCLLYILDLNSSIIQMKSILLSKVWS